MWCSLSPVASGWWTKLPSLDWSLWITSNTRPAGRPLCALSPLRLLTHSSTVIASYSDGEPSCGATSGAEKPQGADTESALQELFEGDHACISSHWPASCMMGESAATVLSAYHICAGLFTVRDNCDASTPCTGFSVSDFTEIIESDNPAEYLTPTACIQSCGAKGFKFAALAPKRKTARQDVGQFKCMCTHNVGVQSRRLSQDEIHKLYEDGQLSCRGSAVGHQAWGYKWFCPASGSVSRTNTYPMSDGSGRSEACPGATEEGSSMVYDAENFGQNYESSLPARVFGHLMYFPSPQDLTDLTHSNWRHLNSHYNCIIPASSSVGDKGDCIAGRTHGCHRDRCPMRKFPWSHWYIKWRNPDYVRHKPWLSMGAFPSSGTIPTNTGLATVWKTPLPFNMTDGSGFVERSCDFTVAELSCFGEGRKISLTSATYGRNPSPGHHPLCATCIKISESFDVAQTPS